MMIRYASILPAAAVLFALLAAPVEARQTATTTQPPATATTPPTSNPAPQSPDLSTDLNRIREGLKRPRVLNLRQEGTRFYLQILGERTIDFYDYLRNSDLRNGPVPRAGVTHQDFLNHITPKYLYSSGGIRATELLEWGLVNWLGQMAVKKLFSEIGDAARAAELRRIRDRIDRELAALKGGGK
jgi:hypothetical protein